jgi:hypothetical protein
VCSLDLHRSHVVIDYSLLDSDSPLSPSDLDVTTKVALDGSIVAARNDPALHAYAPPAVGLRAIDAAVLDAAANATEILELASMNSGPASSAVIFASKADHSYGTLSVDLSHQTEGMQHPAISGREQSESENDGVLQRFVDSAEPVQPATMRLVAKFSDRIMRFSAHFNTRTRLKRLAATWLGWHCLTCKQRRLHACVHRITRLCRRARLSKAYAYWAAFAAEQASQVSTSSSKLQQEQLMGLGRILQKCRSNFTNRVVSRRLSTAFSVWRRAARNDSRLRFCSSRFALKRMRKLVERSMLNWIKIVFEQKHQISQSASAKVILQEQQLQQSHKALEGCFSFFIHRLQLKDAALLIGRAFEEWSKLAVVLRRASAVAKKFVLRYMNLCIARAFFSWADALHAQARARALADMISASHNRNVRDAFVQWSNITYIQKAAQQVCTVFRLMVDF